MKLEAYERTGGTTDMTDNVLARPTCSECKREFDLFDPVDAAEWYYGHDCEAE